MALRQLDAVAKCMEIQEIQATTMACKIGMAFCLQQRMKMQQQRPAQVAQPPLRQVTNFISGSTSASATKKRALSPSMSKTARDVVPNALQFPRPDDGKMYTALTAIAYTWRLHQQDPKLNLYKVANELIECGLIAVSRDNMVKRYRLFVASINDGHVEDALDRVRPFHDRGKGFLVHKQECIEFARSMAHHDRAISVDDVAFLTSAKKRRARDAGLDDSMCREVCQPTVKGYLQVFEDMPGDLSRSVAPCKRSQCGGRLQRNP